MNKTNNISIYGLVILSILFLCLILYVSDYHNKTDLRLDAQKQEIDTLVNMNVILNSDIIRKDSTIGTISTRLDQSQAEALQYASDKNEVIAANKLLKSEFDKYKSRNNSQNTKDLNKQLVTKNFELLTITDSLKILKNELQSKNVDFEKLQANLDILEKKFEDLNNKNQLLNQKIFRDSILNEIISSSIIIYSNISICEDTKCEKKVKEIKPKKSKNIFRIYNTQWVFTKVNGKIKMNTDLKLHDFKFAAIIYNQDKGEFLSFLEKNPIAKNSNNYIYPIELTNGNFSFDFINYQEKLDRNYILEIVVLENEKIYSIQRSSKQLFINGKNAQTI